MPESKGRKKDDQKPKPERNVAKIGSPPWIAPAMVACFIIGLAYIVVFYVAGTDVPVMKDLNALVNVGIGFAFIIVGFALSTKWR